MNLTCPIANCDPTRASCPQQSPPLPPPTPPLSPEETCERFGCIEPLPEGVLTPAQEREQARRFIEGLDNRRYNLSFSPAAEICRSFGVDNTEGCGGLTVPAWNLFKGYGRTIENGNKLIERLGTVPRIQPVPTGPAK
jgi:hypothetical protein